MNEEKPDKTMRDKIKRGFIAGVEFLLKFLQKERIVIEKDEIKSILPHRGGKLFLDRVTITAQKIIGEFLVTAEACEGHEIGGQLMFRGVDYLEMTAQLLGVWLSQQAAQHPNLNGKLAPLRKGSFKCIGPSFPGDHLRIEISVIERNEENEEEGSPRIENVGREGRLERSKQQAIAVNAAAWVGDRKKAVIYFVELGIIDAKRLS